MSTSTMSFALPQALRSYIEERVRSGAYGNASEFIRELVRRDQEEQARLRLRELIEQGLRSGPPSAFTADRRESLLSRALGAQD